MDKYFDASMSVKLRKEHKKILSEIAIENKNTYKNASHVARVAIIKFIQEYKGGKDNGLP